ncbi:MAG: EAL domain-containing protein [Gloeomargaritaceae cyanobacterium C42_A2020_066]|nr:EAL domain-containing protein [Gloeomargaritaceae cyanobacterium C42_A2020_066]
MTVEPIQIKLTWEDPATGEFQQVLSSGPVGFGRRTEDLPSTLAGQALFPVILRHQQVSKKHAFIVQQAGRVEVVDESTNGTYLNGQRLHNTNRRLNNGDQIQIGPYRIKVTFAGEETGPGTTINADQTQVIPGIYEDALTGLPNRTTFVELLEDLHEQMQRTQQRSFAVVHLDVDRFKVVNDALGYSVGDTLLAALASRLKATLAAVDIAARLEGDEFAVLLQSVSDLNQVNELVARVRRQLALPFNLNGEDVFVTVSTGIALGNTPVEDAEDWLRFAQTATERAKTLGRGRCEVFSPGMEAPSNRLRLETDLWRAVERSEFRLFFQPIICLTAGRMVGFEALARWIHPQEGLVPTGQFIALAEETGLILPIGQWVLQEACRQLRAWQTQFPQEPPLSVSVNLSPKQFAQEDLVEQVRQVLVETGLNPSSLKLEITESTVMENEGTAASIMAGLRSLGAQLLMDDFGTGYSSLSRLHSLPLDVVKIDKSFVDQLDGRPERGEVVRAIVTLAHNLGQTVIAEGIETLTQLNQLRQLGCGYGQGFLFSKPLPVAEVEALISTHPRW